AAELDVFGLVDGPHAALAHLVEDAVAPELLGQDRIGRHGTQDSARAGNSVREFFFTIPKVCLKENQETRNPRSGIRKELLCLPLGAGCPCAPRTRRRSR